jgi:hypothetical protein
MIANLYGKVAILGRRNELLKSTLTNNYHSATFILPK